jgi:hypothetical protein
MTAPATYDRQLDEPEDAWVAFYRYRDSTTPRRALSEFAREAGFPASRLMAWATRYDWASRLVAWDQRVDSTRQAATLRGVEEMAARHIGLAKRMLALVEKGVERIENDFNVNQFTRLKAQEMARLTEVAAKLERLSRGEATEVVDGLHDYSKLTDEDLAALEEISRKL